MPPLNSADDELDSLVASVDDIVDGLEAFQVLHADSFIEALLGDVRYLRHRQEKLIEQFRAISMRSPPRATSKE